MIFNLPQLFYMLSRLLCLLLCPLNIDSNCWGVSLYLHNVLSVLRISTRDEFNHLLKRRYQESLLLRFGDLIVITNRRGYGTEHSMIYLCCNYVFHKPGLGKSNPPQIRKLSYVLALYTYDDIGYFRLSSSDESS